MPLGALHNSWTAPNHYIVYAMAAQVQYVQSVLLRFTVLMQ